MYNNTLKSGDYKLKTLRPRKHIEYFIADETAINTFRDELASMEHPFFALKAGDVKSRTYKNNNVTVIVRPAADLGLATIFDKDLWIYSISKLQQAINQNEAICRTIIFTPYDFFRTTNRASCSRAYDDLKKALARLKGTTIETNIVHSDENKKTVGFGLIDSWEVLEQTKGKLDIGMISITLPDWLYEAIKQTKVLQISPDYFRIRKAIDRRLYEIARKHCGNQPDFVISLEKLHLKTGSTAAREKFRFNIKQLEKTNDLPDYEITYEPSNDSVTFKNRSPNNVKAIDSLKKFRSKQGLERAKTIIQNSK